MAALDLLRLANDTDELREHVRASFSAGASEQLVDERCGRPPS